LYYGYCTVFLKQHREKLFVATRKHLRATFAQFFADFSAQFARNLRKLRAIFAHFQRNFRSFSAQFSGKFCANFAFFPRDFLQGLYMLVKEEEKEEINKH